MRKRNNNGNGTVVEDNTPVGQKEKVMVKHLLEKVRTRHLHAAEELKRLLSEIDGASLYLLREFARVADWDPEKPRRSEMAEQIYYAGWFDYYVSLDHFLDLRTKIFQEDAEKNSRDREAATDGRES